MPDHRMYIIDDSLAPSVDIRVPCTTPVPSRLQVSGAATGNNGQGVRNREQQDLSPEVSDIEIHDHAAQAASIRTNQLHTARALSNLQKYDRRLQGQYGSQQSSTAHLDPSNHSEVQLPNKYSRSSLLYLENSDPQFPGRPPQSSNNHNQGSDFTFENGQSIPIIEHHTSSQIRIKHKQTHSTRDLPTQSEISFANKISLVPPEEVSPVSPFRNASTNTDVKKYPSVVRSLIVENSESDPNLVRPESVSTSVHSNVSVRQCCSYDRDNNDPEPMSSLNICGFNCPADRIIYAAATRGRKPSIKVKKEPRPKEVPNVVPKTPPPRPPPPRPPPPPIPEPVNESVNDEVEDVQEPSFKPSHRSLTHIEELDSYVHVIVPCLVLGTAALYFCGDQVVDVIARDIDTFMHFISG